MGLNAYSNCTPLTTGCYLYQDSGLTTPVADGVYSNGTDTFTVSGGAGLITSQGTCPTTTTTTTTTTLAPTTTTTTTSPTAAPTPTTTTTTTTLAPTTTTTTTTTTEAPTTTTTTTTTTEAPTTTTTTTTTTEAPTTTTTTTTTTEAPTTTTTTTTTTEAPTTTTTTTTTTAASITCTQWTNLSGVDAFYDWTDCDGTIHLNQAIPNNISICAQDGSVAYISGGTLTQESACGVFPSTTTTTTTTTSAPTTTTTTTTTTATPPANIQIVNGSSIDISITGMQINSVPVSYSSGTDFPINTGDPQGNFTSNEIGTYTVEIFYTASSSGQNLSFQDSNLTITCVDVTGSGSLIVNNAVINATNTLTVSASIGSCV